MKCIEKIMLYIKVIVNFRFQTKSLAQRKIDCSLWRTKFMNLVRMEDARCNELLQEFLTCELKKISLNKVKQKNKYSPILFCVIKNDFEKLPTFMEHYRRLGVEVFVFLDNCSTDGTREYLCTQKDVIVYSSEQEYSSVRRVAWINRLLAIYGCDRWCMVVDSDELVTFIGSEELTFRDVIRKATDKGHNRIAGFMLDMYTKDGLFMADSEDYVDKMCWFDRNSYQLRMDKNGLVIKGGPRGRMFGRQKPVLSKYPLFYFGKDDFVASSHYMTPAISKEETVVLFAICHYKFMDDKDLLKIKEAVEKENYAGNSADYKAYLSSIEKIGNLNFYDENISTQLKSSEDLHQIRFLQSIDKW